MLFHVARQLVRMVSFEVTLITVVHDLLLVHGSNVLSQIPFPEGCVVTLWALNPFSFSVLLFDVCCDGGPPPYILTFSITI